MDGKSRWADNIMIERRFLSLKIAQIYFNDMICQGGRKLINDYVEEYYSIRPYEALNYKVPDEVFMAVLQLSIILCYVTPKI